MILVVVVQMNDEYPLADVDLRRRQSDSGRVVHCLEHVIDQLLKERLAKLVEIDFPRDLAQRGMIVGQNRSDVRHGNVYETGFAPRGLRGLPKQARLVVTTAAPSPSRPYPLWPTLGTIVLVLGAGFFAMIVAGIPTVITLGTPMNPGDVGANIVEAAFYLGGLAVLVPMLERVSHRSLSQLGVRPLDKFSWAVVAILLVALLLMQIIYQAILGAFHQENHVQAGFEHFRVVSPAAAIMVLLTGSLIAPIAEELFFRGLIFNALASRMPVLLAAVISGVLFGLGHGDLVLFPALTLFGILQAICYRISGNLIVPIIVHAANNAILLALMIAIPGFR